MAWLLSDKAVEYKRTCARRLLVSVSSSEIELCPFIRSCDEYDGAWGTKIATEDHLEAQMVARPDVGDWGFMLPT
jgi:hypothetical protein